MEKDLYIKPYGLADEETLYAIEQAEKARLQYNTDIKHAKDEGKAEGMAEGIQKGKAEGMAEGKTEKEAEMVRTMYTKGQSIEFIAEITDISLDDIKKILNI